MKQKLNYSIIQKLIKKNRFLLITILVSFCSTAWAITYRWNDDITSGYWNTPGNWQINTTGNTYENTSDIPGEDDLIYIRGSKDVTITIPLGYEAKCKTLCTNSDSYATGNIEIIINGTLSILGIPDEAGGSDDIPTSDTSGLITNGGANNSGNTILTINNNCNFSNIYIESLGRNHPGTGTGYTKINVAEGKKLKILGRIEMSGRARAYHNSTLNISGSGIVSCAFFDTATNQDYTQTINIDTDSTFSIEEYYFGDAEKEGISKFTGTGTLKIPAAGAHMNWGSTCGFTYADTLKILANDGNSYYRIAVSGLNAFPGTPDALKNITIQLQCDTISGGTAYVYFPFKITKITNKASAQFKFDKYYTDTNTTTESQNFEITTANANDIQGYFAVQAGGNKNVTKDITLSTNTAALNNADGFSIEILTPDKARVLSSIEWYYKTPTWVGTKSSQWHDPENWAGLEQGHSVADTFNTDYKNYDLKINSSATRMPVISDNDNEIYNLNSLTIGPNASFTINGGTLNAKVITIADNATKATFTQNGGTLQIEQLNLNGSSTFTGNGNGILEPQTNTLILNANANIPENMILAGLKVTTGSTVKCPSKLYISGNFYDAGTFETIPEINLINNFNQDFEPNTLTTYNIIKINKNNSDITFKTNKLVTKNLVTENLANLNFEQEAKIESLEIKKAIETKFYNKTNITKITDTENSGRFVFSGDTTILNDTTFNTTSEIYFGNLSFGSTAPYFSLNHTAGKTITNGTITAENIDLSDTECQSNTIINCETFTLGKNLTKSPSANWIKINGELKTTASNITIEPNLILNGSFTNTDFVTLNQSLYIYNANANPSEINLNKLIISGDLIFNSSGTINCLDKITANNIILYNGNLTTTSTSILKSKKDIILLGANYTNKISSEEYKQNRPSSTNYSRVDFTTPVNMPDNTPLPIIGNFSGTYKAEGGATLFAGKNFYANGISFNSINNSNWYIDIPNISDSKNGFAETYNCSVEYSTIRCHNNTEDTSDDTSDGTHAQMPAYNCTDNSNNLNWIFDDLEIVQAYTVRDNVIYIEFSRPLRNKNGEINGTSGLISTIKYNNNTKEFDKIYTTADCSTEISSSEDIISKCFYIHAKSSWNTDATGTTSGNSKSTDRNGQHNSSVLDLTIPNTALSDIWGKKIINYAGNTKYTAIEDKTGPILYSVRTGQEMHTIPTGTPESQHSYDAHNFIEFRYSEPVDFGSLDPAQCDIYIPAYSEPDTPNIIENIQVTNKFGALQGNISENGPLNFAGIGTISEGKIHTCSYGATNKYVNALYRQDEYSIRISIAGYTNGTVLDDSGNEYKKWEGYIEAASIPSGEFSLNSETNNLVTDQNGNKQIRFKNTENVQNPTVNSAEGEIVYGKWDISAPIFAPLHMNVTNLENQRTWKQDLIEGVYQSEAIGNNSGVGSTLDRIEFHILDNTPDFTNPDLPEWVSEIGWCDYGSEGTKEKLYKGGKNSDFYCADIFGGARQFNNSANRTSGGVRYCTVYNAAPAFKYIDNTNKTPNIDFSNEVATYTGANAIIFTGTSQPRRSALDLDGLYFGLSLGASGVYGIKTTFTVSYDDTQAYITDLAGNRLKSQTFTTIDRTPPSFDITISPINNDEIFITFVKQLITKSSNLSFTKDDGTNINVSQSGSFEKLLPHCFKIISIAEDGTPSDSTTTNIDTSRPAQVLSKSNSHFTCIKLYLTKKVTLEDVKNLYIQLVAHPDYTALARDPLTNHPGSKVTFIQDTNKNFMEVYTAHALSDFAVNTINPLYAYDETMSEDTTDFMNNLYGTDSWAVHDWNQDQKNYGRLPANHDLAIVCGITDGKSTATDLPKNVKIYLSDNPTKGSVSTQYNADLKENLRIWLPDTSTKVFSSLAEKNNTNYIAIDSQFVTEGKPKDGIIFHLPKEITSKWKSNSQISFLFGLLDENNEQISIIHSPEPNLNNEGTYLPSSTKYPLFALRLKNPSDITTLDLWSFKIKNITEQRGGVTILNNVINSALGEKTVVKVNLTEESRLNVIVMTLDGNVVKYLNRGHTQAGEHYFYWDGTNTNNKPVARGIYFVRISASGIDETRKVIVVK